MFDLHMMYKSIMFLLHKNLNVRNNVQVDDILAPLAEP